MEKKWTQCDEVVRYMTIHGAITQQEADRLGIKRLASRINDLRNDGYAITTENVKVKSRFGDTYVARYRFTNDTREPKMDFDFVPIDRVGGLNK